MLKIEKTLKILDESKYAGAGLAWAVIRLDAEGTDLGVEDLVYCESYRKPEVEAARCQAAAMRKNRDDARIWIGVASGVEFCAATFGSAKRYL